MIVLALISLVAQSGDASIGGTVVDRLTQAPLARARVTLRQTQSGQLAGTAVSDSGGKFKLSGLAAGKYSLDAERLGYRPQGYNQKDLAFGLRSAIVVGPGEEIEGLVFAMTKAGALAGRVSDGNGDPVRNAEVQSYLISGQGEHRTAYRILRTTTNDLGEYRIQPLAPGTYAVSVAGHPWTRRARNEIGVAENEGTAYPVTFYPASMNPSNAAYLNVSAGQTVRADITLAPLPAARLRLVLGAALAAKPGSVRAVIANAGPLGTNSYNSTYYFTGQPEKEIDDLAPGHYQVWLYEGENVVGMTAFELTRSAVVRVGDQPMTTVHGTVKLEAGSKAEGELFVRLSQLSGIRGVSVKPVAADGTFSFSWTTPGRYSVAVAGGRESVLTALEAKGAALREGILDVPATGDVELSLTVSTNVKQVVGFVRQGKQAISGALVVLVPRDLRDDFSLYRFDQSDSDGSFTWYGVLPGEYLAFAFADALRSDYDSAAIFRPLGSLGQPVTIHSTKGEAVNVNITPLAEPKQPGK
ncbi:MAG: carboxypeptidase-like regulatory domain-containing protein [Acidobacteria bacterium]|nr:carboxypeptidase-like regulatory domain-containing protein [Acidobacteriota bacterium]